jgi:hypothetical protein
MIVKRFYACVAAAAAMLALSGCLAPKMYVDKTLGDVPAAERVSVVNKKPVQLLFQFQTAGKSNARATEFLSKKTTELVTASGLFSQVSTAPVQGGALLSVTINNIAEGDAASKGFATGLTLGLAGSTVIDRYVGTVSYSSGTGAATVNKEYKHQLFTQIGAGEPPANGLAVKTPDEGVNTIVRQLLDHLLNDLAKDPAFSGPKVAAVTGQQIALAN